MSNAAPSCAEPSFPLRRKDIFFFFSFFPEEVVGRLLILRRRFGFSSFSIEEAPLFFFFFLREESSLFFPSMHMGVVLICFLPQIERNISPLPPPLRCVGERGSFSSPRYLFPRRKHYPLCFLWSRRLAPSPSRYLFLSLPLQKGELSNTFFSPFFFSLFCRTTHQSSSRPSLSVRPSSLSS